MSRMTPPIELNDEDYQTLLGLDAFGHDRAPHGVPRPDHPGRLSRAGRPGHRPHVGHPRSHGEQMAKALS